MEAYPSILTQVVDTPIFAFDKLDGSCIRAEWTRKTGFRKFGTRRRLLDPSEPGLGEAVGLFRESHEDALEKVFREARFERATAFLEFSGDNSFAGQHEDEDHSVVLFDIHVYKRGLLEPKEFLKLVGDRVEVPSVLHEGRANNNFIESVRESTLPGMTFEGVVCKGPRDKRNRVTMFKVKSWAWLDKLKDKYGEGTSLYEQLK